MEYVLHPPALGPLIGHVTTQTATIWLQGPEMSWGRQLGLVMLLDETGQPVESCLQTFALPHADERCGVARFAGLRPDTRYVAYCAVLVLHGEDLSVEGLHDIAARVLHGLPDKPDEVMQATFRTFAELPMRNLSFLLGSCRYPGLLWPSRKSDRIFASMHAQCHADASLRFVLMNGDQIYADKLSPWLPFLKAETPADFSARYRTAFASPGMRDLLRSIPTYMILDDHEIENDWNSGRLEVKRDLFETAITSYRRYQWLHSPRNYTAEGEVEAGKGDQLFYSFECDGYPFFVMDSRSQRVQDDERCSLVANHMLGDPAADSPFHSRQLEWLCNWLIAQQQRYGNRPKFVVSPSTFVPNDLVTAGNDEQAQRSKCTDDAWAAFPATRRQLLQSIVQHNIQNVIFLCGDSHSSCVAEIHFEHSARGTLPLVMHSITASAFYWPWPFANGNPDGYVHDSVAQQDGFEVNGEVTMHYRAYAFEQTNSYTRVEVNTGNLRVQHYNRDGEPLGGAVLLRLA